MSASTTATWGSAPSSGESITDPSDDVEEFESSFTDDDDYPIGPITSEGQAEDEEPSPEGTNQEEKEAEIVVAEDELLPYAPPPPRLPDDEFDEPLPRLHRRRRRPPRRNPLGMANFTCQFLLPAWCAIAAMNVEEQHLETLDLEMLQQIAGPEP